MERMQDVPVECALKLHEQQLRSSRDEKDIFVGMMVWSPERGMNGNEGMEITADHGCSGAESVLLRSCKR